MVVLLKIDPDLSLEAIALLVDSNHEPLVSHLFEDLSLFFVLLISGTLYHLNSSSPFLMCDTLMFGPIFPSEFSQILQELIWLFYEC